MSDWKSYKHLSLNGERKTIQQWRAKFQEQLQFHTYAWQTELFEFIIDWTSRKEHLQVQSSGSTGRSRKVKLMKDHMVASAQRTLDYLQLSKNSKALLCMPTKFIGGKMMLVRAIVGEMDLYFAEAEGTPSLPEGAAINFCALVPLQMKNICQDPELTAQWKKVDKIIIGSGHVDPELERMLSDWPNDIYETFGMTETISHIALRKVNGKKEEVFTVLPGIEIEIDDRNCIVIKSDELPENPIVTNDVVEMVGKNQFKWMGRADNLINSGGVKIIPEVLEKLIKPLVNTRYFIAGVPDDKLGERVTLFLESEPMGEADQAELLKDMAKELHKYELPKNILFTGAFEEVGNNKINRKKTVTAVLKAYAAAAKA